MTYRNEFKSPVGLVLIGIGALDAIINAVNLAGMSNKWHEAGGVALLALGMVFFKIESQLWYQEFKKIVFFVLWLVSAVITYFSFVSFFLTIVSAGLPAVDGVTLQPANEAVTAAHEDYKQQDGLLSALMERQKTSNSQSLADNVRDARTAKQAAYDKWQAVAKREAEASSTYGLAVFGRIPMLVMRIGKVSAVETVAIVLALLVAGLFGLFIETFMVAAVIKLVGDAKNHVETTNDSDGGTVHSVEEAQVAVAQRVELPQAKDATWVSTTVLPVQDSVQRTEHQPSDAQYIRTAWPVGSLTILDAQAVSEKRDWPLAVCLEKHNSIFGGLKLYNDPHGNRPMISRFEFMKQRANNARKQGRAGK